MSRLAEQTGCVIFACCSPFELREGHELDERERNTEKCYTVSKWLSSSDYKFDFTESYNPVDKPRQRRMKQRFLDCGFEAINLRDNLGNKKRYGYWTFAYIPSSIDREYFDVIKWRLPKRKK